MLKKSSPRTLADAIKVKRSNLGHLREERGAESASIQGAAQDILRAIETKDADHLALALRAAFDILDKEPHVEGPHTEPGDEE